jgi:DNA repair protein RadC
MDFPSRATSRYRDELRRKFSHSGFSGLSEKEAIGLILTLGAPSIDVDASAEALLETFGSMFVVKRSQGRRPDRELDFPGKR